MARAAAALLAAAFAAACGRAESGEPRGRPSAAASTAPEPTGAAGPGPTATAQSPSAGPPRTCLRVASCSPPAPPKVTGSFRHRRSALAAAAGEPRHRGRDQLLRPGEPQWIVAKLAFGALHKDVEDEDVEIFVLRGCAGATWESLGAARTSAGDAPSPAPDVPEGGGRVAFRVPAGKELGVGLHPVRVVLAGDGSAAELLVAVAGDRTPVFVSDVDGTLTGSEVEDFPKMLKRELATAHDGAPEALQELARRGYLPVYLTARPEALVPRTRAFLERRGFPPGVVRTTTTKTGLFGEPAARWKGTELDAVRARASIGFAFGNMASDADAYDAAGILPKARRVFYRLDDPHGGRRIESYRELAAELRALPDACAP